MLSCLRSPFAPTTRSPVSLPLSSTDNADFYHQPRAAYADGNSYYAAGDGGIEFFTRHGGGVDFTPNIANEPSDNDVGNFRGLSISNGHLFATSQKTGNFVGVADAGSLAAGGVGLAAAYNWSTHLGVILWRGNLLVGGTSTVGSSPLTAPYGVFSADSRNVWVTDSSLGISWFQDVSTVAGVRNFTLVWGPEKAPAPVTGVATFGVRDMAFSSWATTTMNGVTPPVLTLVSYGSSGANSMLGTSTSTVYRFNPTGVSYGARWQALVTAPPGGVYRAVGRAPQLSGSCYAITPTPAPTAGPNGGFVAPLTPGNIVVLRVGAMDGSDVDDRFATPDANNVMGHTFADEWTLTGTLVQSVNLNTLPIPMSQAYYTGGTGPSEGIMTVSANGNSLMFGGYNAPLGWSVNNATVTPAGMGPTTWPVGSFFAPRVFAALTATGAITVIAQSSNTFQHDTLRSVCSADGVSAYAVGHGIIAVDGTGTAISSATNGPVQYFARGSSVGTLILNSTFSCAWHHEY